MCLPSLYASPPHQRDRRPRSPSPGRPHRTAHQTRSVGRLSARGAGRRRASPVLPAYDATDIPLFTIDPPTSVDLDQAMHLARRGTGYRVRYAIADVAAFVVPGSALDEETHRRVMTLYFPDEKVPLHPPQLSEGAASLLPDQVRPAALWTIDLDAEGRTEAVDVRRALVRSRAKLDYEGVQKEIDGGTAEEPLALLKVIGRLREELEVARGGISLNVPEQEIVERDGGYELTYRAPLPADGWNAQISLLTGMAAADLMLAHGTGVLRTLPAAPDGAVGRLRRTAHALHIDWPHHVSYAALVRSLDPAVPHHAAFLQECTTLLRGAGYTVFRDGNVPTLATHSAVAAPYAHCTARSAASPTGTRRRSVWRRWRGRRCRTGCWPLLTSCRTRWPRGQAGGHGRAGVRRHRGGGAAEGPGGGGLRRVRGGGGGAPADGGGGAVGVPGGDRQGREPGAVAPGERLRVRLTQADLARSAKVRFVPA